MTPHPYYNAPPYRRWRQAVAGTPLAEIDPVVDPPFRISPDAKVVTAGSCFAQHIARHLRQSGFTYLVTETAHPLLPAETAEAFEYGLYSARYGNIYTSRQLLQLLRRAYGEHVPADDCWEEGGRHFDPFRPAVQPGGFATHRELDLDRRQHLAAVRQALEQLDTLIFTLGLTECWISAVDGSAYPLCPGTTAGTFDAAKHKLINLSADDVRDDLTAFLAELRNVNPRAKLILTVSPVPLAATAEDRHVLVSTTYSKSVLRVAAEAVARLPGVSYFPSYEIVTGAFARGRYFADDLRSVTEEGVGHVMRVFFRHMTTGGAEVQAHTGVTQSPAEPAADVVRILCEEENLGRDHATG